jgi:hypothetical protein
LKEGKKEWKGRKEGVVVGRRGENHRREGAEGRMERKAADT